MEPGGWAAQGAGGQADGSGDWGQCWLGRTMTQRQWRPAALRQGMTGSGRPERRGWGTLHGGPGGQHEMAGGDGESEWLAGIVSYRAAWNFCRFCSLLTEVINFCRWPL
jgi:hypothetical protein